LFFNENNHVTVRTLVLYSRWPDTAEDCDMQCRTAYYIREGVRPVTKNWIPRYIDWFPRKTKALQKLRRSWDAIPDHLLYKKKGSDCYKLHDNFLSQLHSDKKLFYFNIKKKFYSITKHVFFWTIHHQIINHLS
jgi:hypothetical protein